MSLNLSRKNAEFADSYESLGFKSRDELINYSLEKLQILQAQEKLHIWNAKASAASARMEPDIAFSSIDDDEFES